MGDVATTNRHSSNNPQRDQNNQISHGYAERGVRPFPPAAMEALLHCTPSLSFIFSLTIHWISAHIAVLS